VLWIGSVTLIVILTGGEVLYEYGGFDSLPQALHAAALSSITGQSLGSHSGLAQGLEIPLALFSVVVFGTLAASLGALFLERREEDRERLS